MSLGRDFADIEGKHVNLELVGGSVLSGVVYAVDVEAGLLILCSRAESTEGENDDVEADRVLISSCVPVHSLRACSVGKGPRQDAVLQRLDAALAGLNCGTAAGFKLAGDEKGSGGQGQLVEGRSAEICSKECEALEARRRDLLVYLEARHLPLKAARGPTSPITVLNSLIIRSPFTEVSCECSNEMILSRVKALVREFDEGLSTTTISKQD